MPAAQKARRINEDEVRQRWSALNAEERRAVMRFEDPGLIKGIRDAVQALYRQHICMLRLGGGNQPAAKAGASDLTVNSNLLQQVFDLPWNVETSEEFPDAVLMDPDNQPDLMTLQASVLEGDSIFGRFDRVLPDFLGAKSGRTPLHRARWKQLWTSASGGQLPTSVASLEQQLAKLVEQALWNLPSHTALQAPKAVAAGTPAADSAEVEFEDWMADNSVCAAGGKIKAKASKKKPKQQSKRSNKVSSCPEANAKAAREAAISDEIDENSGSEADEVAVNEDSDYVEGKAAGCKDVDEETCDADGEQAESSYSAAPTDDADDPWPTEETFGASSSSGAPRVLNAHYWGKPERSRGFLSCFLPAGPPWARGYWRTPPQQESTTGTVAIVKNTFIDIDDSGAPGSAATRNARSLSPSAMSAQRREECWEWHEQVAPASSSGWLR
eukprot:TRINITY_DN53933_c0_g1_i1.p1 TRINITY_DN53933_c0_g1~~TRINITY_DN53933_c0_g1_i1.p1  ORF type:complete len:442 (+),score=113.81 TRINITY_DN53933_c0_g1_i1:143-1468(+)